MSLALPRRGHDPQAAYDDTLRTMQAELIKSQRGQQIADQAADDLAERCSHIQEANEQLRAGLLDAEREIAALEEQRDALLAWCLPMLPGGIYADDPMPADGSWRPVPGDRITDWPDVPVVDFDAIRTELGLHEVTAS